MCSNVSLAGGRVTAGPPFLTPLGATRGEGQPEAGWGWAARALGLASTAAGAPVRPPHGPVLFQVAHGALSDGALDAVETQKELLGASGLVLLLAPRVRSGDAVEEDVYWLSALLQLKQLLQAKPFQPALPLVVLVPGAGGCATEADVEDGSCRRLAYGPRLRKCWPCGVAFGGPVAAAGVGSRAKRVSALGCVRPRAGPEAGARWPPLFLPKV